MHVVHEIQVQVIYRKSGGMISPTAVKAGDIASLHVYHGEGPRDYVELEAVFDEDGQPRIAEEHLDKFVELQANLDKTWRTVLGRFKGVS